MKLQSLQIKVLCTTGNFPRRTPVRDLHIAFKIPYAYDYITKFCRKQAEVTQNHDNENVHNIEQGLNLAAAKHTTVQVTRLPF
jgi:hypothetical protein